MRIMIHSLLKTVCFIFNSNLVSILEVKFSYATWKMCVRDACSCLC